MVKKINKRERVTEWCSFQHGNYHDECQHSTCDDTGKMVRDTPQGFYCLLHYNKLPTCARCGKPGEIVKKKRGLKRQTKICRNCFVNADDLAHSRLIGMSIATSKSGLGNVE